MPRKTIAGPVMGGALIAAIALSGCSSATGLEDVECGSVPDPSIPFQSGLSPTATVSLDVGESCAVRAETGSALRIASTGVDATYLVAVQSASEVASSRSNLTLRVTGPTASGPSTARASSSAGVTVADLDGATVAGLDGAAWASDAELRLRKNALLELERRGARPARPPAPGDARFSVIGTPPALGDTIMIKSSVDAQLSVDCSRTDLFPGVVRAVGQDVVIVEDIDAAGHVSAAQYAAAVQELDEPVFTIGENYFGSPVDLDGNDRVIVFVTPIVNRATPRGSNTFIAGFFNPSDLSDPETCGASNRGEVLYLLAPDPDGVFSDPVEIDFFLRNTRSVTAHELTHLIVAEQRMIVRGGTFADLDDAWIDEGLAHTSEMAVGLYAAGLTPRGNHDFAALAADLESFNTYHLSNFRRVGYNFLNPARTLALGLDGGLDPGGVKSLEMRGFAFLFFRWMADHATVGGGGVLGGAAEEAMFRDLAVGGTGLATGVENVLRVTGPLLGTSSWRDLLQRYSLAPLADDADGSPTADSQVTTFDLPDIFAGIHEAILDEDPFKQPYPLSPLTYDAALGQALTLDFELFAGASRYLVIRTRQNEPVDFRLTSSAGGPVTDAVRPQVVILRTN